MVYPYLCGEAEASPISAARRPYFRRRTTHIRAAPQPRARSTNSVPAENRNVEAMRRRKRSHAGLRAVAPSAILHKRAAGAASPAAVGGAMFAMGKALSFLLA